MLRRMPTARRAELRAADGGARILSAALASRIVATATLAVIECRGFDKAAAFVQYLASQ